MSEGVKVVDRGFAGLLDEALDHAPVQCADELRVGLGQLAERAMGERDDRDLTVLAAVDRRIEPQQVELADQGLEAGGSIGIAGAVGSALRPADLSRLIRPHPGGRGGLEEQPGQKGVRRRLEPERRRIARQRVQVLGPADAARRVSAHVEQPDVTHALEVRTDSVRMQCQRLRDVGGRQRP